MQVVTSQHARIVNDGQNELRNRLARQSPLPGTQAAQEANVEKGDSAEKAVDPTLFDSDNDDSTFECGICLCEAKGPVVRSKSGQSGF